MVWTKATYQFSRPQRERSAWTYGTRGGGDESSASGESPIIEITEGEEDREDSLFVDQEAELEEAAEEMILSELTKRVAEHMRKQQEKMVKKANSKALEYADQEIAMLQIPKQYRFSTEIARIPVRVLEKTLKVRTLYKYTY